LGCFLSSKIYAQSFITFLNALSKDPIAYVEVSFGSSVLVADGNGKIQLDLSEIDTLNIYGTGYDHLCLVKQQISDTIFLNPNTINLKTVIIKAKKELAEVGFHHSKNIGWARAKGDVTRATFVKSDQCQGVIKHLFFRMKNQAEDTDYIISLFEKGDSVYPGRLVYSQKYTSESGKNLLKIDVLDANVVFPEEGIFVGIKLISKRDEDLSYLKLTKTYGNPLSFFLYENMWFEHDNLNAEYNLTYKIGLEVIPY
jgi:hypothetical protein